MRPADLRAANFKEEIARFIYPTCNPQWIATLMQQLTDPDIPEDSRRRASMALHILDGDNPLPAQDAFVRFLGAQRRFPGARELPTANANGHGDGGDAREEERGAHFVTAAEVMKAPRPEEIVEDLASRGSVVVLAGESGAGKSFVGLDVAAAVAAGAPWCGRATRLGTVAWCAFEGDALAQRLQALERKHGTLDNLRILRASDPISPVLTRGGAEEPSLGERFVTMQLQRLTAELTEGSLPPVVLLVIDTVRASMSGSEDSSENVAGYLRSVRRILAATPTAAALLIHHAGWQDGDQKRKRERGSSAFRGNADGTLFLEAEARDEGDNTGEAYLTLTTLKVRDAERRPPLRLVRRRVDVLGFDHRGEPLSSCVIEEDHRSHLDRDAKAAAAEAEADRATDLEVLRVVSEHADATSRDRIRTLIGGRKGRIDASVSRLLRERMLVAGGRGEPFEVTDGGRALLDGRPGGGSA